VVRFKEGHAGDIYTVSPSKDGGYLATGGADKTVCVWTYELVMKYTFVHGDSIQALAFNPVLPNVLASCSAVDFAIWTMPSTQLRKTRSPSKILAAAWTADGQHLALGMLNGAVSIRDINGAEKSVIVRGAPIWDLSFAPPRVAPPGSSSAAAAAAAADDGVDVLSVACWDGTLSFYNLAGDKLYKERALGSDPCSVRHFSSGEYQVVAGADHKAVLYTRDGVKLATLAEGKDWLWRAVPRPKSNFVAIGSNDGTISMHSVVFATVHGLYMDRYAFRDAMTDVVVQHLVTEQRVRIKCRDYVKKIAVYRDRLAVHLPDRIIVYELPPPAGAAGAGGSGGGGAGGAASPAAAAAASNEADYNMAYRVKDRIFAALECNLLVVTSRHVILCQERKLQLYTFGGVKEREWVLDAVIRYIKVVGGPAGREGLLVGLKSGAVLRVFVDNAFPQTVVKHACAIRCLDLSMSRRKLAVVDELSVCTVYDALSKDVVFSEPGANSVAWNTEMENMLCFSGNGNLSIKTGTFPLHTQKMAGFVVGFNGSKIFCLQSVAMQTIDVPQSASLYRFIDARDWDMAYRVACLGVTDSDWRTLGEAALKALQLRIARSAFVRLSDMRYLELISFLEASRKGRAGGADGDDAGQQASLLAEVAAYSGRYADAGRLHLKGGTVEKAIEMFSDLRLWGEARKFAEESGGRVDVTSLMLKQASWCEETGDAKAAATIYAAVGQAHRAVQLLGERALYTQLVDLVRTLPSASGSGGGAGGGTDGSGGATPGGSSASGGLTKDVRDALTTAGDYFKRADMSRHARECYVRLGDNRALLHLHLDAGQWGEALALASQLVEDANRRGDGAAAAAARALLSFAHLSHGEALAADDKLEAAQAAYEAAGRPDLAARILEQLAVAALEENKFEDAAAYYARLAVECARAASVANPVAAAAPAAGTDRLLRRHAHFARLADIYRAYDAVHAYVNRPFTTLPPDAVLNAARTVLNVALGVARGAAGAGATRGGLVAGMSVPYRVSITTLLFTLVRQGMALGCYKQARFSLDRLSAALVPARWRDTLDLAALSVASKPFVDKEELVPVCYRCGAANGALAVTHLSLQAPPGPPPRMPPRLKLDKLAPRAGAAAGATGTGIDDGAGGAVADVPALAPCGDACVNCAAPFVRSALSFEVLPLVEFVPDDVTDEEAVRILVMGALAVGPPSSDFDVPPPAAAAAPPDPTRVARGDQRVMTFGGGGGGSGGARADGGKSGDEAFNALLASDAGVSGVAGAPLRVPGTVLRKLRPTDVFIVRPASRAATVVDRSRTLEEDVRLAPVEATLRPRFYKNVIPDIALTLCAHCHRFFAADDYEFETLKRGACPMCHTRLAADAADADAADADGAARPGGTAAAEHKSGY